MLTFGLSPASADEPGAAGAGEPEPSVFTASRGAGGGRGGFKLGALGAGALRSVEAAFGLGFVLAGASPKPYGLMVAGISMFPGPS